MKLLFFQYGDYGAAYHSLRSGGTETYRDQKHSVDFVAALAADFEVTTVAICDRPHHDALTKNLRSIGITQGDAYSNKIINILDDLSPELLICRTPHRQVLTWTAQRGVPVLPVFADIFQQRSIRERWNNWRLAASLNKCRAPAIANHSLLASESLAKIGVKAEKIVPWELRRLSTQEPYKNLRLNKALSVLYAGILSEDKGVGDAMRAIALCRNAGIEVTLTVYGPGDTDVWKSLATDLNATNYINVAGIVSSSKVLSEMRLHDAVVVPSRHSYAEGLPNTIFEAFASRSPLIASDHPAYAARLKPMVDSMLFRAGDPTDLATQFTSLATDPDLYRRLSVNSAAALEGLYCGIEWSELVGRFLKDPLNLSKWVDDNSLSSRSFTKK